MTWFTAKECCAQVTAPSTWTTAIQVQGEAEGTEFDDWAGANIPVATTDPADNVGFTDINEVQIANDDENIYIRVTLHTSVTLSANFFLAFDTDQDSATGYDVFSLGEIGSELGYQYDYPFQQDTGVFNTGTDGVVEYGGDYIGLAVTFPFWSDGPPTGAEAEWAIPIALAIGPDAPGTPVFTSNSFDFMVYSDLALGDVTEVISYTLAENPGQPGDFDGDLDVDVADALEWQRTSGAAGDLTDWQDNFPTGGALLQGITAVPEPGSCLLVVMGLLAFAPRRR